MRTGITARAWLPPPKRRPKKPASPLWRRFATTRKRLMTFLPPSFVSKIPMLISSIWCNTTLMRSCFGNRRNSWASMPRCLSETARAKVQIILDKPSEKEPTGSWIPAAPIPSTPRALTPEMRKMEQEFQRRYEQKYGQKPDLIATLAFSSAYILFHDVIPKAGGTDPDKIRKAALSLDKPVGSTLVGWGVQFNETGQNTRAAMSVMQWQDGKLVVIYPESFSKSQPQMIPMPEWSERK